MFHSIPCGLGIVYAGRVTLVNTSLSGMKLYEEWIILVRLRNRHTLNGQYPETRLEIQYVGWNKNMHIWPNLIKLSATEPISICIPYTVHPKNYAHDTLKWLSSFCLNFRYSQLSQCSQWRKFSQNDDITISMYMSCHILLLLGISWFYPYPSCWHWGHHNITLVPVEQPKE